VTLSRFTVARLYARLSGVAFLLLAFVGSLFFMGLAWFGINASGFIWPWMVMGILGLGLLVARGLHVTLVVATFAGLASTAFWIWSWAGSAGFDNYPMMFAVPLALSIIAALTAAAGWLVHRSASSA
jgi:hypothetical protein